MKNYKQYFKGKKITAMGLGLIGRGVGVTKFLAECGADLIVTDLKTEEQLKVSVEAITNYELKIKNENKIKFVLGEHRLEDFKGRDMIIKSTGVPLDSPFINEARKSGIPIEMDVSLFAKLAPSVMIVGVTGTRGKSMTTTLIYEILKANEKFLKRNVYVGGNLRGLTTLSLLKKVKDGDILVCELDSWMLQGFGEAKLSPNISVFTTFMADHMNYYLNDLKRYFEDKANIYKYQKKEDVLIIRPGMKKYIKKSDANGKYIVVNPKGVLDWKFNVLGAHHLENLACAVEVAKQFDIPISKIKKTIAKFKDLEGRMQLLRVYKGIKIYNDNNATTPEATIAGLEALKDKRKKIILICGGADKNVPLDNLAKVVNKSCKFISLIPGGGTDKFLSSQKLKVESYKGTNFRDIVITAVKKAKRGDVIILSPAFASFGMFNNEYERNDQFMRIIKELK